MRGPEASGGAGKRSAGAAVRQFQEGRAVPERFQGAQQVGRADRRGHAVHQWMEMHPLVIARQRGVHHGDAGLAQFTEEAVRDPRLVLRSLRPS